MLFSLLMGAISAYRVMQVAAPPLPDQMVLYLEFEDGLEEVPKASGFADPFSAGQPTLRDVIAAIDGATSDPRVQGIFARFDQGNFALAHVQEVREAIKRFRASGKFAYIYSPSYGDGGGFGGYYLASAFEEIWMQPMGVVSIAGLNAEMPFLRTAMDKIGVTPQFFHRKEYKTAYESLTNTEMSPENRAMTQRLVDDMRAEFTRDIPADRGFSHAAFEGLVNKGLFTAKEAESAKLITKVDYADVLVDNIVEKVTGNRESEEEVFVALKTYIADLHKKPLINDPAAAERPKIALVYAVGAIMSTGEGNSGIAAADEIAPAILEAGDNEDIKAIVLRIDSPGGSPVASESILRAIERAQGKGKKVIVSMGPTAASGGYWIAAYADRIFAMPTTLTGSIGVVGGKFALKDLWEKMGVNWDSVKWGENAAMWSFNTPFTESEALRFNVMLDQIYDGFVERVAKGRKMKPEDVEKIAGGRVWTGTRAVQVGLVDEIGSLAQAMDYTARLLGAADRAGMDVVIMPEPKSALDQILEFLGEQGSVYEGMKWHKAMIEMFGPVLQQAAMMKDSGAALTYEPLRVE